MLGPSVLEVARARSTGIRIARSTLCAEARRSPLRKTAHPQACFLVPNLKFFAKIFAVYSRSCGRPVGYEPGGRRFESCRAHHKIKVTKHLRSSIAGLGQRLDLLVSAQKFGVLLRMTRRANSSIVRLAGFYRGTHADRSSGKLRKRAESATLILLAGE